MSNLRWCEECGRQMVTQRRGARFCGPKCKNAWHNKRAAVADPAHKRLEAPSTPENGPRRASRDGSGTKLYLTEADLRLIDEALYFLGPLPESAKPLQNKLDRALQRVGRKEQS